CARLPLAYGSGFVLDYW
nr:immunoglobulin heavy chain junction region [Macaca mulatta]MOX02056.1 immunoglobulin heavy chain junction region [Macaca mulatta]MOX02931.1 immunoglobulin heavy chain junction region [Macaca mulatta]MOX04155.1 immunoglobulin heavy chain junction region [Macaca mulatta]MOX05681.1 immunoglobulin heavy chain junction region [Macaca mulatta]